MEEGLKILVTGGRYYSDKENVYAALDWSKPSVVITGGASGADYLAERWAKDREVPYWIFPAQWKLFGKAAGMMRNRDMLEMSKPDMVIAFPGGRGTEGMKRIARESGVEVVDG